MSQIREADSVPPITSSTHTGPREAAGCLSLQGRVPRISTPNPTPHLKACSKAGCFAIINNFLPPSLPQTCSTSLPTGSRAGLTFEPTIILSLLGEARRPAS